MKTISDRIFELMKARGMSQKTFSEKTGIAQSTISDWKKKKTNPVSDKILIISETLGVSPYELLSGAEHVGTRSNKCTTYVVDKGTELGNMIEMYQNVDASDQKRIIGYMQALMDMKNSR